MNVLSARQQKEIEQYSISNKGLTSLALMERAAKEFVYWFEKRFDNLNNIHVFCGIGNNGGDGLAIARILHNKGYNVIIHIVWFGKTGSSDFEMNLKRVSRDDIPVFHIHPGEQLPELQENSIIIDAILGSGLNKPVIGIVSKVIDSINQSSFITISVDIPSGLSSDKKQFHTQKVEAEYTITFQMPKLSFFLAENSKYVGEWQNVYIGLDNNYIEKQPTNFFFVDEVYARSIASKYKREKYDTKDIYGHALVLAGSQGKTGAAILASKACIKSGAGLVTAHIPKSAIHALGVIVPEVMVDVDEDVDYITRLKKINKYSAIGVGPGIGTELATQKLLLEVLHKSQDPLVIDADGLNIIAENKSWLKYLPANSILTPHVKEFERLLSKTSSNIKRIELQQEFSITFNSYIVLKGAHTAISCPDGNVFFNSTGNPGMATAGSGDVLTGIITGLLAQGINSEDAAILGVYLHGLAGDLAAEVLSMHSLTAGDIIEYLPYAFKETFGY